MPLFLGRRAHPVDKVQSRTEIRKRIASRQMMPVHHFPSGHLDFQVFQLGAPERRYAAPARHAMLFSQTHRITLLYAFRAETGLRRAKYTAPATRNANEIHCDVSSGPPKRLP